MKQAIFHKKAREFLQQLPKNVRSEIGKILFDIQSGLKFGMPISRPMPIAGKGVEEIRVRDRSGIYRAFYISRYENVILVFHVFQKKTQETPMHEIAIGRRRLKELLDEEV